MLKQVHLKDQTIAKATLGLVLLFTVLYYILAHEGIYYSDDLSYSYYAAQLLKGEFDISDPGGHTFIHRLAVYVPNALLYAVAGVNKFTYTLWPLLCTLGSIVLIYFVLRSVDAVITYFALCFLSLTFYFIFFSTFLYPDNIVAFFAFAAILILYNYHAKSRLSTFIQSVGFVSCLFIAFLAKETVVFIVPFLLLKMIQDFYHQRNYQLWLNTFLVGIIIGGAYFAWYYTQTGNLFYRFTEIERANLLYKNHLTDLDRSLLHRLTVEPLLILIETGTFPLVLFMFGGIRKQDVLRMTSKGFWVMLFLTSLATFWFMSTSYTSYNPISLDGRMFNLLLPPLCIAAAWGFKEKLQNWRYTSLYAVVFLLIALLLRNNQSLIYGLLGLYFAAHTLLLFYRKQISFRLTALAIAAILAIRPVYFMFKPKSLYYKEHKAVIGAIQNNSHTSEVLVLAPHYLYNAIPVFYGYKLDPHVVYQTQGISYTSTKYKQVYMIENTGVTDQPSFAGTLTPDSLQILYPNRSLVAQFGPIRLYRLK